MRERDRGLGLPRLKCLISLTHLRVGRSVAEMEDPLIRDIKESDYYFQRMTSITGVLGSFWPLSSSEINQLKCRLKAAESEK
jgi:hypothetical protein